MVGPVAPFAIKAAMANPMVKKVVISGFAAIAGALADKVIEENKRKISDKDRKKRIHEQAWKEFVRLEFVRDTLENKKRFMHGL